MVLPGQFSIGSTGQATYSIPISVPPGTSGVAPTLALDYSSQSGDGPVGISWNLAGLPIISRCPRTLAQDGVHGSVNYDANDRFCMDGSRLILVVGTYGADGSEYRTEIESFSKIIAHGSVGSGPAWFEVHNRSGQIIEFGHTADSQALTVGLVTASARVWAANKLSDTAGNYLTVSYNSAAGTDRTTYGEIYPVSVAYTGHGTPSVVPYNSVQFIYTVRTDTAPMYQAGALVQSTVLLSHIRTYQGVNLVMDYALSYRAGTATTRSRLTSLTQCDAVSNCLPATNFEWQGGENQLNLSGTTNSIGQGKMLAPGDFNGDGLTDVAVVDPTSCNNFPIYLAGDLFHPSSQSIPNPGLGASACYTNPQSTQTFLSPSGVADFLYNTQVTAAGPTVTDYVTLYQTFPNSRPLTVATGTGGGPAPPAFSGDFNGDGIPDYMLQENPNSPIYIGDAAGDFAFLQNQTGLNPASVAVVTADFDGDGCTDILSLSATNSVVYFCNPATASVTAPSTAGFSVSLGDFNGDGKTDLLLTSPTVNGQLWLSTGTGFTLVNSTLPNDWGKYSIVGGDWNGDGKSDILLIASGASGYYGAGTSHKLFISTGTGFSAALDANGNPIQIPNGASTASAAVADWNNDGGTDFWLQQSGGGAQDTLYTFNFVPELMTGVSNGIGATTTATYDRLNKGAPLYSKGPSVSYPDQNMNGPFYVVSRVDSSNGLGTCVPPNMNNCLSATYSYTGAQSSLDGRGFLGFAQTVSTDLQTHMVQTTNYSTAFPYIALITSRSTMNGAVTLNTLTNQYGTNADCGATPSAGVNVVCLLESQAASTDLNGAPFPSTTTNYTYDNFGNPLTVSSSVSDGSSKVVTSTYNNDTVNWYLGQLLTTSVRSIVGSSDLTRQSSFAYDATTGLLVQQVLEPGVSTCNSGSSSCTVTTNYTLDPFGHRVTSTVSGTGIATRTSYAMFDALGQFQTTAVNALGQYEFWTRDPRFGGVLTDTDANYLTSHWTYDGFGRTVFHAGPDSTSVSYAYSYCSGGCPAFGAFNMTTTLMASNGITQIGPTGTTTFDMLSRVVAADTQGFDGDQIRVTTEYDALGRAARTSRPYITWDPQCSGAPCWNSFVYDNLGRVTQATAPDSGRTNYGFSGLTTTVTNSLGQTTTTIKNAQGLNASVTDAMANITSYLYDAFGDAVKITDAAGNIITNSYDIRGNKVASVDPDLGSWSYVYDVLGKLASQTDAKGQVTNLTYDLLGRLTVRDESGLYSSWTYGNSVPFTNIGKLIEAKACTDSSCTSVVSDRNFYYDGNGRAAHTVLAADGNDYGYTTAYDPVTGKIAGIIYPSGLVTRLVYNNLGYLCRLAEGPGNPTCADAGGSHVLWTINARDAEQHVIQSVAGNGVVTNQTFDPRNGLPLTTRAGEGGAVASFDYGFDLFGNLSSRTDHDQSFTESFCYDRLNRLTNYALAASCTGAGAKSVGYDALGNIIAKSDVGSYIYPATGSGLPHAVSAITGTVNGLVNPLYTYDANGNLTCTATGPGCTGTVGQTVSVTAFNMAAAIIQGTTTVGYTYDSEHARIVQASTVAGTTTATTYLNDPASGSQSEMVKVGSASPIWTDYLTVDGHIVAQRTANFDPASTWGTVNWNGFSWGGQANAARWGSMNWGGANWSLPAPSAWGGVLWGAFDWQAQPQSASWSYFTLDHLGSVAVITDANGTVTQRLSYDAWGKQRNPNGTAAACGAITSATTRGYTNQEEVAALCLVNLNSRFYDPTIGKMLSADSVVPDPSDGQSFNRYSYVTNRPLSLIDPTGHINNDFYYIANQGPLTDTAAYQQGSLSLQPNQAMETSEYIQVYNNSYAVSYSGAVCPSGTECAVSYGNPGQQIRWGIPDIASLTFDTNSGMYLCCSNLDNVGQEAQSASEVAGEQLTPAGQTQGTKAAAPSQVQPAKAANPAPAINTGGPSYGVANSPSGFSPIKNAAGTNGSGGVQLAGNFGVVVGAGAEAGIGQCQGNNCGAVSAGGQVSWYGSVFFGGGASPSVGAGQTTGNYVGQSQGVADSLHGSVGAYGGVGVGVTFGNSTSNAQVSGPFNTQTVNTPLGSVSYSTSGSTWQATITVGPGALGSVSNYGTNTKIAH